MRRALALPEDLQLARQVGGGHERARAVAHVGGEAHLAAGGARVPVDEARVPQDEVALARAHLGLVAAARPEPRRVARREVVAVLALAHVLRRPEPARRPEVLRVQEVRPPQHAEPAVRRPVGRQVGYALV